MSEDQGTTGMIAIYGAIVATLSLAWNVYKWWTDRGKLMVHCMIGRPVDGGYAYIPVHDTSDLAATTLLYRVTNVGNRPITVRVLGGTHVMWHGWRRKRRSFSLDELGQTLEPSDYFLAKYHQFLNLGRITALEAIDSRDRHYQAPWKDVHQVRQAISQLKRRAQAP